MSATATFTHVFAVPGEDSIVAIIDPATERSSIRGEDLAQIRERYPLAEVMPYEKFAAAKAARQDTPIGWVEVTAERYDEMLGVVPPALMLSDGFLVGEPTDHHAATGRPRYAAFVQLGEKCYESTRPLTRAEFRVVTLPRP